MSEEPKITNVEKTKDPRRVEAGKRLGMISKQAKERKARERSEAASEVVADVSGKNEWTSPVVGVVFAYGFAGAITGLVLYFACGYVKKYKTGETGYGETVETGRSGTKDEVGTSKPKRVYKELDTLD